MTKSQLKRELNSLANKGSRIHTKLAQLDTEYDKLRVEANSLMVQIKMKKLFLDVLSQK